MRVKFRKPPLDELVIGSYFPPIEQLQAQHIGLFWATIIDAMPTCQQQPPLVEIFQNEADVFPLPRFWFVSPDDSIVVQLQRNAFITNWRKRGGDAVYPHFENVKEFYDMKFAQFANFVREHLDYEMKQVASLELAYINFLPADKSTAFADLAQMLPGLTRLRVPKEFGTVQGFTGTYSINVAPDISVTLKIDRGKRVLDNKEGLRFEIRAKGLPEPPEWASTGPWFDKAHDYIGELFLKLTSSKLQRTWGPIKSRR